MLLIINCVIESPIALKFMYFSTALLFGEFLYRLLDTILEYHGYKNHYEPKNRIINILKITFNFKKRTYAFFGFYSAIILCIFLRSPNLLDKLLELDQFMLSITYIVLMKLQLHKSSLDAAEWIRSGSGLDYAAGMASNYFNGYIRLNLPEKGDDKKGIIARCEEYEDTHKVKFATKKLVILIPHSMHIKPVIKSDLLEKSTDPVTVERDRAGVKRPFKNDVYRLTEAINGTFYRIVLEGATPLLSFRESCESDITSTPLMKAMKREILFQFYRSIKKYCLLCPETQNEVDFIYYNDYNSDGKPVDVGKIVKSYVEENCPLF